MKKFNLVKPEDLRMNPFQSIGKEWMLITAEKEGRVNAMTASWGGMGVMWSKNVVFIFVRKSRFTKEMIDAGKTFSISFYDTGNYREMLSYMGCVSGRDEDKIEKMGLTVRHEQGVPYFEEARLVMLCKKMSRHLLAPEGFNDGEIDKLWYADRDYHEMYVGEITEILAEDGAMG